MRSFEFVFILFLMNQVIGITDILCRALQSESQDILNAVRLVSSTKELLQKLRINGCHNFLQSVISFCERHDIDAPDITTIYTEMILVGHVNKRILFQLVIIITLTYLML